MGRQWTNGKRTQIMDMEKKIICKYSLFKECFKIIIIPWDSFYHEDWKQIVYLCEYKVVVGVDLIYEILLKSNNYI